MIITLLLQNKHKSSDTLGISINTINSKIIQKTTTESFKYFYEPKKNTIEKVSEWGPNKGRHTINNDSLNERFDYSIKKNKGIYRIITLGDSFTYGVYVDTVNNWTEILEEMLGNLTCTKKIEVINLGVYGYDPSYEVERYKIRGVKYNPDMIIWFLVDPNRISELINDHIQKNYEKMKKDGVNMNSYEPWEIARKYVMLTYGEDRIGKYQSDTLKKINDLYSGEIVIIFQKNEPLSSLFPYVFNFKNDRPHTKIHEIINIFNQSKLHFLKDFHPNIEGHKAIAEDVFNYLTKNNLIPCGQ